MRKGTYKDLEIYRLAHGLAVECHKASLRLPKFEMYEEGSQLRRSSKSISNLIVEGFGRRRYKADFVKFLVYSQASCDETKEHLEMLYDTQSLTDKDLFERLMSRYDQLGAKISKFIASVEQHHRTP
ncbi:MAG: four helix bundle protein [Desulfobacterales bacterium]|nr:four helix bundle protein [Desulfobacterales bacterium]